MKCQQYEYEYTLILRDTPYCDWAYTCITGGEEDEAREAAIREAAEIAGVHPHMIDVYEVKIMHKRGYA